MRSEFKMPEPPAILPDAWKEKWVKAYQRKLDEALQDEPDLQIAQAEENQQRRHWLALREANRLLRVPQPTSYAEAVALEDWQVIVRREEGGFLFGVTIDAKKFRFSIPKK